MCGFDGFMNLCGEFGEFDVCWIYDYGGDEVVG